MGARSFATSVGRHIIIIALVAVKEFANFPSSCTAYRFDEESNESESASCSGIAPTSQQVDGKQAEYAPMSSMELGVPAFEGLLINEQGDIDDSCDRMEYVHLRAFVEFLYGKIDELIASIVMSDSQSVEELLEVTPKLIGAENPDEALIKAFKAFAKALSRLLKKLREKPRDLAVGQQEQSGLGGGDMNGEMIDRMSFDDEDLTASIQAALDALPADLSAS
eukprot:TRINITY_DN67184_c0_g1_i1.p1 TRINITY_DN67184_c0_g1~~TRINITY_DN67184_c0_g1_i1.p1  ORF type:complete len:222 (-),score=39.44 TRINITY_DN67184_c0_g1_i1:80-745(-)